MASENISSDHAVDIDCPVTISSFQQHPSSLPGIFLSSVAFRLWDWLVQYIPSYVISERLFLMEPSTEKEANDLILLHCTLSPRALLLECE